MGKYWRARQHTHTGYPYSPLRMGSHVHVVRPRIRHQDSSSLFIGLFMDPSSFQSELQHSQQTAYQPPGLKRLAFVRAYGTYYSAKLASIYGSSRRCVPHSWHPRLQMLEEHVSSASSPLRWGLHIRSEQLLWALDSKIDGLCDLAHAWLGPKAALADVEQQHEQAARDFSDARTAYLRKIEEAIEYLRSQGISGTARQAVAAVMGCLEDAQHISVEGEAETMVQRMSDAWVSLATVPAVSKMLQNAQPSVEYARGRYLEAHHTVVASRTYDRALKSAARMLRRMQHSPWFKSATQRLYALVSPLAEPTIERITGSSCYRDLVDHLTPVPEPAALPQAQPLLPCAC